MAARYPVAAATFAEADDLLGFKLSDLCFNGPEATLTDTVNAQPALLATSVALLRVLEQSLDVLPRAKGRSMWRGTAWVSTARWWLRAQ